MIVTLSDIKKAYALFANPLASKATVRFNVRQYLRSLAILGDKWQCASINHVQRVEVVK